MKVVIEETCTEEFEVDVPEGQNPYDYVAEQYYNGAIVLSPGECQSQKMLFETDDDETEIWQEF